MVKDDMRSITNVVQSRLIELTYRQERKEEKQRTPREKASSKEGGEPGKRVAEGTTRGWGAVLTSGLRDIMNQAMN